MHTVKRLPPTPAERALKVLSGRWKAVILYQLFGAPLRLAELQRRVPGISQKMLIQQLREMQEHGLVARDLDYQATPLGLSLEPLLRALCAWGQQHAAALDEMDRLSECRLDPVTARTVPAILADPHGSPDTRWTSPQR